MIKLYSLSTFEKGFEKPESLLSTLWKRAQAKERQGKTGQEAGRLRNGEDSASGKDSPRGSPWCQHYCGTSSGASSGAVRPPSFRGFLWPKAQGNPSRLMFIHRLPLRPDRKKAGSPAGDKRKFGRALALAARSFFGTKKRGNLCLKRAALTPAGLSAPVIKGRRGKRWMTPRG